MRDSLTSRVLQLAFFTFLFLPLALQVKSLYPNFGAPKVHETPNWKRTPPSPSYPPLIQDDSSTDMALEDKITGTDSFTAAGDAEVKTELLAAPQDVSSVGEEQLGGRSDVEAEQEEEAAPALMQTKEEEVEVAAEGGSHLGLGSGAGRTATDKDEEVPAGTPAEEEVEVAAESSHLGLGSGKDASKCKACNFCLRNARKLQYGASDTMKKVRSPALEQCIAAVDTSKRPITTAHYPPGTLIFSVCEDVSFTCAKYEDWRGVCPKGNPRVFENKYGVSKESIPTKTLPRHTTPRSVTHRKIL
ncbi:hypothetical protein CYMTET_19072 [Cymbomonas tetramitiformis]|uniref:Uncharacterized protein n=1 Tax=Cymbomonas tetramitiformis TaxID=36881 RepID=A0AAE0G6U7_9CHLO|nr:hypothetical protein CYMTET_19072 [Cymbomonas tetramitiformis]